MRRQRLLQQDAVRLRIVVQALEPKADLRRCGMLRKAIDDDSDADSFPGSNQISHVS